MLIKTKRNYITSTQRMPQFEENRFAQKIKQEKYIKHQAKGICNSADILGLLFSFLKLFSFVCQFLNSSGSFAIPCEFKAESF